MGTQGLVSVVRDGQVVLKAVCGCDGYNAKKLTQAIMQLEFITADIVYDIAKSVNFGCVDCLVVSERVEDAIRHKAGYQLDGLPEWYVTRFNDPGFNPRWECGIVYHRIILRWPRRKR